MNQVSPTMRRLSMIPLLLLLAGCGREPYRIASVSGRVTLNNTPLANAAVTFQPIATEGSGNPGPGSGAITNADGHYTLVLIGKQTQGAVVGWHKVRITLVPPPSDPTNDQPPQVQQLPARYNVDTELEWEVTENGTTTADFPLTSP